VSQKNVPLCNCLYFWQILANFWNSFTRTLFGQFAIKQLLNIPPHHNCIATLPCHRRVVAQLCVNGDQLSKRRMATFDPTQIRNPSTDRHKIWNRWLHWWDDPHAKFRANPSIGGFSANGWNITKNFLEYIYLFYVDRPTGPTGRRVFTHDSSNDAVSRKGVPF